MKLDVNYISCTEILKLYASKYQKLSLYITGTLPTEIKDICDRMRKLLPKLLSFNKEGGTMLVHYQSITQAVKDISRKCNGTPWGEALFIKMHPPNRPNSYHNPSSNSLAVNVENAMIINAKKRKENGNKENMPPKRRRYKRELIKTEIKGTFGVLGIIQSKLTAAWNIMNDWLVDKEAHPQGIGNSAASIVLNDTLTQFMNSQQSDQVGATTSLPDVVEDIPPTKEQVEDAMKVLSCHLISEIGTDVLPKPQLITLIFNPAEFEVKVMEPIIENSHNGRKEVVKVFKTIFENVYNKVCEPFRTRGTVVSISRNTGLANNGTVQL
jgi:hypothetical protein